MQMANVIILFQLTWTSERLQNLNWLAIRLTNKLTKKNVKNAWIRKKNVWKFGPVGEVLLWSINQLFYSGFIHRYTLAIHFVHDTWCIQVFENNWPIWSSFTRPWTTMTRPISYIYMLNSQSQIMFRIYLFLDNSKL